MDEMERAYWTHEVAKRLDIGESTLRKWCIELEKNGYVFVKGAKGSRAFTDHDIIALTYLKSLTREKNHKVEQAAKTVVENFNRKEENDRTLPDNSPKNRSIMQQEETLKRLLDHIEKQEEFNKELLKRLDNQERYIKESLEKRDKLLIENLRSSMEQSAAKEKEKIKELSTKKKILLKRYLTF